MTHDEVTAAMNPEDVPAELVEKAARALRDEQCTGHDHGTDACPDRHCRDDRTLPFYRARVRPALAAVLPEIQAQALRDAADLRHGTDLTPTTMSLGTDQGWWYEYLQRLDETWRANLRARAARLTTAHDPRCISLTDSEFNDHCDCRTLAMIDRETKGPTP